MDWSFQRIKLTYISWMNSLLKITMKTFEESISTHWKHWIADHHKGETVYSWDPEIQRQSTCR